MLQLTKFMQNCNSLASQTDLDKFLTIFQVNFRIFLRKFQNFPILKKVPHHIDHPKRHLLPKFKPSRIFTKISKLILNCFDSWVCSRNFINPAQVTKGSRNLKYLRYRQILTNARTASATPRDRRIFFLNLNLFFWYKNS
jgi:hypothetical protein